MLLLLFFSFFRYFTRFYYTFFLLFFFSFCLLCYLVDGRKYAKAFLSLSLSLLREMFWKLLQYFRLLFIVYFIWLSKTKRNCQQSIVIKGNYNHILFNNKCEWEKKREMPASLGFSLAFIYIPYFFPSHGLFIFLCFFFYYFYYKRKKGWYLLVISGNSGEPYGSCIHSEFWRSF